jgi:hypothetical protein
MGAVPPSSGSVSRTGRSVQPPTFFFENFRSQADNSQKRSIELLSILKKDRITSRQFSKKFEQVAKDFKKRSIKLLRILKKDRIGC